MPTSSFRRTLFPVPLRPITANVSPSRTSSPTPFRTVCEPKDLWRSRTLIGRGFRSDSIPSSRKGPDHENQSHHQYVSQNYEEGSQNDGACCRSSDTLGTSFRTHTLKTC